MKLNREQEEAVKHLNGPCMVLAPPGSGKTSIVTSRTKHLIEKCNVNPESILVITFTRYAAREMRERFQNLTMNKNYPVTFGTFHSVFYGILRHVYGINGKNLLSEAESFQLLQEVLSTVDIESTPNVESEDELVKELQREISLVKNGLYKLNIFKSEYLTQNEFESVFRCYEQEKKKIKKFDFDDMLVQCYALFKRYPDVLKTWQERFKYILIDEFQDINKIQYEIICMLAKPEQNVFVVGDDDQSIYGFRGADPKFMLNMKKDFPKLRTIALSVNYRSTEYILGSASRVILHNDSRFYKRVNAFRGKGENVQIQEVLDEMEESRLVAAEIQKQLDKGTKAGEIAVLYRAGIQARMLTEILNEHRIPFEMKEHIPNFYDHFVVRDILAYMRLASGRRDRHLFLQILNRPVRYIARNSMPNTKVSFEDFRRFYIDKGWMQDIIDQFDVDIRMMQNMTPYAAFQYIRKKIGYEEFLKEYAKEHEISWEQLLQVLQEFEGRCKLHASFSELENHIETYTQELEAQKSENRVLKSTSEDKVQLMTMHSSKGLEFEQVYIIHANEGEAPYQKAETAAELEEERRMFYVAMTRAKNGLTIFYMSEKNGNKMIPSRFVEEILGKKIKRPGAG